MALLQGVDQLLSPLSEAPWVEWVVVCNRPLRFTHSSEKSWKPYTKKKQAAYLTVRGLSRWSWSRAGVNFTITSKPSRPEHFDQISRNKSNSW